VQLDGIEGRVAFVTGGGRGIGRQIAETLRDLGSRVAAGDLEPPAIEGVLGVGLDVSKDANGNLVVDTGVVITRGKVFRP